MHECMHAKTTVNFEGMEQKMGIVKRNASCKEEAVVQKGKLYHFSNWETNNRPLYLETNGNIFGKGVCVFVIDDMN